MIRLSNLLLFFVITCCIACSNKPSQKIIEKKLLMAFRCSDEAVINNFKIVRTEERKGTHQPHQFIYSVSGEVEWPDGCELNGSDITPGTKEKLEKTVTFIQTASGWQ